MNSNSVSQTACAPERGAWIAPAAWGLGAGLTGGAATALFALLHMPLLLRLALVILPVVLSLGYVYCVVGIFRQVDELQRRIQLESLGFAFPATAILVMTVNLMQEAKVLPDIHWNWGMLVSAMCFLWIAGYVMACRRYR